MNFSDKELVYIFAKFYLSLLLFPEEYLKSVREKTVSVLLKLKLLMFKTHPGYCRIILN